MGLFSSLSYKVSEGGPSENGDNILLDTLKVYTNGSRDCNRAKFWVNKKGVLF